MCLLKLILSRAAQLGFTFLKIGIVLVLHIFVGPAKGHITEDRKIKKTAHCRNQTHDLSVTRRALYLVATTAAQSDP